MDRKDRFELAALRPYIRGNPIYFLGLMGSRKGRERSELIEMLSPLSRYQSYGDDQLVAKAWPGDLAHLRRAFMLKCRLPCHVIPVFGDSGDGFMVPMACRPSDEWDASDACARFSVKRDDNPADGLIDVIESIERAWEACYERPLPLRWRRAYAVSIAIPVHAGDIEGGSMHLPIALMLLREACASFGGEIPWGPGPVFCTGPVGGDGTFRAARAVREKLEGFVREYGSGRCAILTKAQCAGLPGELLAQVSVELADNLSELVRLPALTPGLEKLAGPPPVTEIDHLTRLMGRLHRSVRFTHALQLGTYLLQHEVSPAYEFRVLTNTGHLLLHEGRVTEARENLDRAMRLCSSPRSHFGVDQGVHCLAVNAILHLDCGDPPAALRAMEQAKDEVAACSHLGRIEVAGTSSQAWRAIGEFDRSRQAAEEAVRLAKEGLASEAGRDLNYLAHTLIRQAESAAESEREPLLSRAQAVLNDSMRQWAPIEPARLTAHQLFCRHYQAEIKRLANEHWSPGPRPEDLGADWRHPWLFELLSCSRNTGNPVTKRREWAERLVSDSKIIKDGNGRGRRIVFELFHLTYRVWEAALNQSDTASECGALVQWCQEMAGKQMPGWQHILGPILRDMPETPEARIEWADRLCSAIYFH